MRPVECCRLARPEDTVRQVFARPLPSRRTGAVMIVNAEDHLVGIFTDSDLARLFGIVKTTHSTVQSEKS
jgi:arabinose-5-phosphate isomerase